MFESVQTYCQEKAKQEKDDKGGEWRQELPAWCTVRLAKLLRQVMEGKRDSLFSPLCCNPPKGGIASITFTPYMMDLDEWKDEISSLNAEFQKWCDDTEGIQFPTSSHKSNEVVLGGQSPAALARNEQDECSSAVRELKDEIAAHARNIRETHVGFVVQPSTVAACVATVNVSAMTKKTYKASGEPSRIAFIYALSCAYDGKGPSGNVGDKRDSRPLAMAKQDFEKFVSTVSSLVTPLNENYVCVLVGRARRQGAGLQVEAGLSAEQQVLQVFGAIKDAKWRVKTIRMYFADTVSGKKGVCGILSESVYFFYKGSWPSRLTAKVRKMFGGTTWDDTWRDVPAYVRDEFCKIPQSLKDDIFEDIRLDAAPCRSEENANLEEEGGDVPNEEDAGQSEKSNTKTRKGRKGKKKKDKKKKNKKDGSKPVDPIPSKHAKSTRRRKTEENPLWTTPIELPSDVAVKGDEHISEPLCHLDYHGQVWQAICEEWDAAGAMVWTIGNATCAKAAVRNELPLLAFSLNESHMSVAKYLVDVDVAKTLEATPEAKRKIHQVLNEDDHSIDSQAQTSKKAKKEQKRDGKEKKEKKEKEKKKQKETKDRSKLSSVSEGSESASGDDDDYDASSS